MSPCPPRGGFRNRFIRGYSTSSCNRLAWPASQRIAAGEEIEFGWSSSVPYDLSVVKLGAERTVTRILLGNKPNPFIPVPICTWKRPCQLSEMSALTLECWIRPFQLSGLQGLLTQHDYPEHCGVGLFLSEGKIVFGTGSTMQPPFSLPSPAWSRLIDGIKNGVGTARKSGFTSMGNWWPKLPLIVLSGPARPL